jgi:hypothetical protein
MEESSVAIMPLPPDSSMTVAIIPLSIKGAKQKAQISITPRPRPGAAAGIN